MCTAISKQVTGIFFPKWEADVWVYAGINAFFRSLQFEKVWTSQFKIASINSSGEIKTSLA